MIEMATDGIRIPKFPDPNNKFKNLRIYFIQYLVGYSALVDIDEPFGILQSFIAIVRITNPGTRIILIRFDSRRRWRREIFWRSQEWWVEKEIQKEVSMLV